MLKIGVLGAGHLGKIHIRLLKEIDAFNLVGFFDPDTEKSLQTEKEFGIKAFPSMDALIDEVNVVDIVTPTLSHFECASRAVKKSRHIFIEKPLTNTLEEAENLVKLVEEAAVKAQVGHVERFNPAFVTANQLDLNPVFIESHRLSQFNPRGTDVSVVLDLMIHDIDIVLSLIKSNVKYISASGVDVMSETPDIASARIEFDNGAVVNLTASRISLKKERKMRLFQKNAYITIDFVNKQVKVFKLKNKEDAVNDPFKIDLEQVNGKPQKVISYDMPKVSETNAIKSELEMFAQSIINDTAPVITVEDGFQSLKLAHQILNKINMVKID